MSKTYQEMKNEFALDIEQNASTIENCTKIIKEIDVGKKINANKYQRECRGVYLDVYDILKAFEVINPAVQHAIKKLLASGKRGYKDTKQDLEEARDSITRAIELEG